MRTRLLTLGIAALLAGCGIVGTSPVPPAQLPADDVRPGVVVLVQDHDAYLSGAYGVGSWSDLSENERTDFLAESAAWLALMDTNGEFVPALQFKELGYPVLDRVEAWTVENYPWDPESSVEEPFAREYTLRTTTLVRRVVQQALAP